MPVVGEILGRLRPTAARTALSDAVTPETIRAALAELRAAGDAVLYELATALANEHGPALVAAFLPGLAPELDLRTGLRAPYQPEWGGDLWVGMSTPHDGACVRVHTERGAQALRGLAREQRAAIVELQVLAREADAVAELWFDGVQTLVAGDMPGEPAAALILRCPSLAAYHAHGCPADVLDALATAALRDAYLDGVTDDVLARLARHPELATLELAGDFGRAGLAHLAGHPALRVVHARAALDDAAAVALAAVRDLEEVRVGGAGAIGEPGGQALATLPKLRLLDLHDTRVGDATAIALARLPGLAELDLAETFVGGAGVRALAAAPALRRLGLSFHCADDVTAAALELRAGVVEWNDYDHLGSALWPTGDHWPP